MASDTPGSRVSNYVSLFLLLNFASSCVGLMLKVARWLPEASGGQPPSLANPAESIHLSQ